MNTYWYTLCTLCRAEGPRYGHCPICLAIRQSGAHHLCEGATNGWLTAQLRSRALEWHARCQRPLEIRKMSRFPQLIWWHPSRGALRLLECGRAMEDIDGRILEAPAALPLAHKKTREHRCSLGLMREVLLEYDLFALTWQRVERKVWQKAALSECALFVGKP